MSIWAYILLGFKLTQSLLVGPAGLRRFGRGCITCRCCCRLTRPRLRSAGFSLCGFLLVQLKLAAQLFVLELDRDPEKRRGEQVSLSVWTDEWVCQDVHLWPQRFSCMVHNMEDEKLNSLSSSLIWQKYFFFKKKESKPTSVLRILPSIQLQSLENVVVF